MCHVFTNKGLRIDPEKAKAVVEMPRPEDAEGVQRLSGFVNCLAKLTFLPRLADVMELLRKLTRPNVDFEWTEDQGNALKEIKRLVTDAPVVAYYDSEVELEIQCDASMKGLGAALL